MQPVLEPMASVFCTSDLKPRIVDDYFCPSFESDLLVICQHVHFHVHREVLAEASAFFKWATNGRFQVRPMLEFMYYNTLPRDQPVDGQLLFLAEMYALADLYTIPTLKDDIIESFSFLLDEEDTWEDDSFMQVIVTVYLTTPETDIGLRQLIAEGYWAHGDVIAEMDGFKELAEACDQFRWNFNWYSRIITPNLPYRKKVSLKQKMQKGLVCQYWVEYVDDNEEFPEIPGLWEASATLGWCEEVQ